MRYDFKWGEMSDWANEITGEMDRDSHYQKYRKVSSDDIVLDIGANVGAFSESLNATVIPKQIYCIEPYGPHFECLKENMSRYHNTHLSKVALSESRDVLVDPCTTPHGEEIRITSLERNSGITFKQYLDIMNIDRINFMKMDVEGYEYDIINPENYEFVYSKVDYIAAEYHLFTTKQKAEFAKFREGVLRKTGNFRIEAVNGVDVTWSLYNDDFIDNYKQIYIYINNR